MTKWTRTPLWLRLLGKPTFRRLRAGQYEYSWHGALQHLIDQLGED